METLLMSFWLNKRVLITGGYGFLGSYVVEKLFERGCFPIIPELDLREQVNVHRIYQRWRPNIVLNLAATVGGIQANLENPAKFLYDNLMIGMNMIDATRHWPVDKFVQISSACSYPGVTPLPTKEVDLWNGFPEASNASYGIAKRALITMCQAYHQQYGVNAISLIPTNLYGPRDHFDPQTAHVIPALIKKCLDAKEYGHSLEVWGTGEASREFIHAEDCAEGILEATEFYNKPEPVNLGTGKEITIRSLVLLISHLCGFLGPIIWDKTKPNGQLRRCLDVSKAKEEFGFEAKIDFTHGLAQMIDWYVQERRCGRLR
jgi:GDP-L-fucose synthase